MRVMNYVGNLYVFILIFVLIYYLSLCVSVFPDAGRNQTCFKLVIRIKCTVAKIRGLRETFYSTVPIKCAYILVGYCLTCSVYVVHCKFAG